MNEDFLLGVLAVQLGFASPAQVMAAASAWLADPSSSIAERLATSGALDSTRRQMLQALVTEALKQHQGDVQATLHTLGGEQVLFRSFGGSVVADGEGKLRLERSGGAEGGAEPASESTLVSSEQPGRYVLRGGSVDEAEIGRGGLGRVLIAYDEHLGREVAIKELLGEPGTDPSTPRPDSGARTGALVARFLREARVTGQLEHPNIVPVHEVGQRKDGTFFYSMRIVRGKTLGEKLKACGSLFDRLALLPHYVDLCNAVAYAHSRGVVHRDVKPNNVMIGEFGETVVLDWGLAKVRGKKDIRGKEIEREVKILHEAGAGHTIDGSAVGTPAYMSPEQAEGRIDEIDERSDVWGLGAVLYEVLTGHPPFEGVTPFEILGKVLRERVAPVRGRCAEAPAELSAVAEKALEHEPANRYESAKSLADEVESYLQGRRVSAYTYSSRELVRRFFEKNKALSAGAALVLATLVVSSLVIWLAYGREQTARTAAEAQRREAVAQEQEATLNLAQAYVSTAEQHLRKRHYSAAFVYAAAALREARRSERPLTEAQRVALESVLYEAKTRRYLSFVRELPGPTGQVYDMSFSRDGQRLALIDERGELWLHQVDGSRPPVRRVPSVVGSFVRFANDGQSLLAGFTDGVLRTYALADLRETRAEPIVSEVAVGWDMSPDEGRLVVVSAQEQGWLLARSSPEKAVSLGATTSASMSPSGSRVARCAPGAVVSHDGVTGEPLKTVELPDPRPSGCVHSPDGARVLVSTVGGPKVVDLEQGKVVGHLSPDHAGSVLGVATPDGRGWVLGPHTGALLWNGVGSGPSEVLWEGTQRVFTAVSSDGRWLAMAHQGAIRVFEARTTGRVRAAPSAGFAAYASFTPDSRFAAFSDISGKVYLVDLEQGAESHLVAEGPAGSLPGFSFARDGKELVVVGGDQVLKVIDVEKRAVVRSRSLTPLRWGENMSSNVRFTQDGTQLLVTEPDDRVYLLDYASLETVRILSTNLGYPQAMQLSADGGRLIVGDLNGQIAVWSTRSWQLLNRFQTDAGYISDLAVSRDGTTVITASMDGWVRWFDLATGATIRAKKAHEAWVNRLTLSPDGKLLLTGSDDRTAKLWDAASGTLRRVVHFDELVAAVAFSPDGKHLAIGGDGALFLFPHEQDALPDDADALYAEAVRTTALELDGLSLVAQPEHPEPGTDAGVVAVVPTPGEVRGRVRDFFFPDKALAEPARVELVHAEDETAFAPSVTTRTDAAGAFLLRLPEGIERYAVRIGVGQDVTYGHYTAYRRGAKAPQFTLIPLEEVASLATRVGISPSKEKGQVIGSTWWSSDGGSSPVMPVGCVEVTVDDGAEIFYAAPRIDSRVHPERGLKVVHPGAPLFYVFNLEPGPHKLVARVGGSTATTTVHARAGVVTSTGILFDAKQFPENPTPPLCLADWPPTADGGK